MPSVKTDGSQTAVVTTEHTLATITDAGVYDLVVDVSALQNAAPPDAVEICEYVKARSGDTERLLQKTTIYGAQTRGVFRTTPRMSPHYIRYTLKQTQGTARDFPWAVNQV